RLLTAKAWPNDEGLDLPGCERFQKLLIVLDRHAAVGITLGAKHIAVREQSGTPEHVVVAHRNHAERLDTMKQSFSRFQVIDIWRRCTDISLVHASWIVHQTSES